MRDRDVRESEPAAELGEEVQDLGLDRDVERGDGLVENEDQRLGGERPGDRHALALAARESARHAAGFPLAETDFLEEFRGSPPPLCLCPLEVEPLDLVDPGADPLARIERRERILEDHLHGTAEARPFWAWPDRRARRPRGEPIPTSRSRARRGSVRLSSCLSPTRPRCRASRRGRARTTPRARPGRRHGRFRRRPHGAPKLFVSRSTSISASSFSGTADPSRKASAISTMRRQAERPWTSTRAAGGSIEHSPALCARSVGGTSSREGVERADRPAGDRRDRRLFAGRAWAGRGEATRCRDASAPEESRRGLLLDDPARVHHDDSVRDGRREIEVVRDEEDPAALRAQGGRAEPRSRPVS